LILWWLPDGICSQNPKINRIDWAKSFTNPKGEVSKLNGKGRSGGAKLFGAEIDKNIFFWKLRNQYYILTSFTESKKTEVQKNYHTDSKRNNQYFFNSDIWIEY
jgi:hypothetical protein